MTGERWRRYQSECTLLRIRATSFLIDGEAVIARDDGMSDFRALLVQVSQVLLTQFLVRLELFLGFVLFAGMYVGLAKPIVRVGQVKINFQRTLILGNRICVLVLIRIEIAQL